MSIGKIAWIPEENRQMHRFEVYEINQLDDFDDVLSKINSKIQNPSEPFGIDIIASNNDCLTMIVGKGDETLLTFSNAENDPPYFISLGDKSREGLVSFLWNGTESELPAKYLISMKKGREAAKHFLAEGELDKKINWVED